MTTLSFSYDVGSSSQLPHLFKEDFFDPMVSKIDGVRSVNVDASDVFQVERACDCVVVVIIVVVHGGEF